MGEMYKNYETVYAKKKNLSTFITLKFNTLKYNHINSGGKYGNIV